MGVRFRLAALDLSIRETMNPRRLEGGR